jgi:hypothetical protein
MKYFLIIIFILITSCSISKSNKSETVYNDNFSLKDEMNKSIIDGFYNGDTTNISQNIYFIK